MPLLFISFKTSLFSMCGITLNTRTISTYCCFIHGIKLEFLLLAKRLFDVSRTLFLPHYSLSLAFLASLFLLAFSSAGFPGWSHLFLKSLHRWLPNFT